jgi:hypothetical protein
VLACEEPPERSFKRLDLMATLFLLMIVGGFFGALGYAIYCGVVSGAVTAESEVPVTDLSLRVASSMTPIRISLRGHDSARDTVRSGRTL